MFSIEIDRDRKMAKKKGIAQEEIRTAIDVRRKRAETKSLDISLNELADMYSSGELQIRPEFQRLFRWSRKKQSQFIESLLLEMPVPAIFVIENSEGEWELIDGLQRISSFLHYRGELKATDLLDLSLVDGDVSSGTKTPAGSKFAISPGDFLKLEGCDILPEINGTTYVDLPVSLQFRLKRSFLRVETIRQDTDKHFKYYMFKRLNSGGEKLSDQEIRNCTIRLLDEQFNSLLIKLSRKPSFLKCTQSLSVDRRMKMDDVELVLRFFAFKNNFREFKHDVSEFLSNYMERVSDQHHDKPIAFDYEEEEEEFDRVFDLLNNCLGEFTCVRWLVSDKFGGPFLMQHFEAFSLGVAKYLASHKGRLNLDQVKDKFIAIKKSKKFFSLTTGGGQNSPGPYREKIDFVYHLLKGN